MPYWCAAQLQPQRDGLAPSLSPPTGIEIYAPRLREPRTAHGRKVVRTPLLFPGYLFVRIELQWHAARWAPGVVRLVHEWCWTPAAVPDGVITDLQGARNQRPDRSAAGHRNSAPVIACESSPARSPGMSFCMPG